MGQSIVTSHSPYVIEQFDLPQVVILNRDSEGNLSRQPINAKDIKPRTYRTERRQFAEAILSRAVLVVEGSTEAALFPVASTVMERSMAPDKYTHFDLAGVTMFTASGDGDVPRYGPIFTALGKLAFAFYDKPGEPLSADASTKLAAYTCHWASPEKGVENLLAKELPLDVLRRFLVEVQDRADYPTSAGPYNPAASEADIRVLVTNVLKARKGEAYGYASILIDQCQTAAELPNIIRTVLEVIHQALAAAPDTVATAQPKVEESFE